MKQTKLPIFLASLLLIFTFCAPKQLKTTANQADQEAGLQTSLQIDSAKTAEDIARKRTGTHLLGIPYSRIDSFKNAGIQKGGHPDSDSATALYVRLSDSTRIIGTYHLSYDGQFFTSREFNKKNPKQLDIEIKEERKGIVSIQKRMMDKPDYFPLLNQKIEFYNDKNQLISSYDINKNNPFLSDKSKKVKESVYPPPTNRSELLAATDVTWKKQAKNYYAYNHFHVQENGYALVEYQIYAMDAKDGILKSISTLIVLDSTGKEYARMNELENMLHSYWMVSGGKYLMVNGGGILGEGFQRLEKSFLKIYEVAARKMIYEETLEQPDDDFSDFFESESPYKISLHAGSYKKTEDHLFTEYIFNLDTRTRCTKIFSQSDWNRIANEGIKYSGNAWLHTFKFDCKTF